jgi:flap endonuclease-1
MGVAISEILPKEAISISRLAGRTLVVDAYNILYQFLTTIRTPDGTPLKDEHGRVTSHLVGLFARTTNLMVAGVRLAFIFDGPKPALKSGELARRKAAKDEAAAAYADAVEREDVDAMRSFSARSVSLTSDMVSEAKELLSLLGIPVIDALSEAEAQASRYVAEGFAYAVVSQDADCLVFGAPRMIRNLSISGRRKKPGTPLYITVEPELVELSRVLAENGLTHDQLINLCMLVGTDFNPGGIKGIGPKKALKLVKEHSSPEALFSAAKWEEHHAVPWHEVREVLTTMPTHPPQQLHWGSVNRKGIETFLTGRGFSKERFAVLDTLGSRQQGLGEFW